MNIPLLLVALCTAAPVRVLDAEQAVSSVVPIDSSWLAVDAKAIADLPTDTVLILPNSRSVPALAVKQITGFLERGGHLIAVGGPPFEKPLYLLSGGRWGSADTYLASLPASTSFIDWATVNTAAVERGSSQPKDQASYSPLHDGFTANIDLRDPIGWETRVLPCTIPAPGENDVIQFKASGTGNAKSLLIELRERDSARWMAVVPLSENERLIGLHRSDFKFWHDSSPPTRGQNGDQANFASIAAIVVGFASSHQWLPAGHYTYTLRVIATAKAGPEFERVPVPTFEGMSPSYKTFTTHPVRYDATPEFTGIALKWPAEVVSPVARAMQSDPSRDYTWQPLIKAFNDRNEWIATPLSTTWGANGATWTLLGWRPSDTELSAIVGQIVKLLEQGKPATTAPALIDKPVTGPCVRVTDGRFALEGKPWFAHGINYWPLYTTGMAPPEYYSHWLTLADYIPELIEADLATLEFMGVNLVSVQYERTDEAPPLRDFLSRCGSHNIKVNLFLRGTHPTEPQADDDLAKRNFLDLIRAANLRGNPNIFAYDLAWEPRLGGFNERKKLDALFEQWLVEQYGSVAHAEHVWNFKANYSEGKLVGPTDEQLKTDGPHRVMVAAYRRFTDDLISRRYGEIIRIIKTVDDTHLFGARTGYGGTGTRGVVPAMPFQLTAGAAHLDFVSPEGYGYSPKNISDAALVVSFARWAGNGKPVFWAEFGMSVWDGGEKALAEQGALYDAFADMVKKSNCDGWAGWWFPGGYRVDERSDFGIVAQDRTLRPSALTLQRSSQDLKSIQTYTKPAESLTMSPDENPAGIAEVIERLSKPFHDAYNAGNLLALQTSGTGTTSANCPNVGVGGIPFEAPGPAEYLNAELAVTRRDGTLYITATNTGEGAWTLDDCSLTVAMANGTTEIRLKKVVARFDSFQFELPDNGACTLSMQCKRFGNFGQRIKL